MPDLNQTMLRICTSIVPLPLPALTCSRAANFIKGTRMSGGHCLMTCVWRDVYHCCLDHYVICAAPWIPVPRISVLFICFCSLVKKKKTCRRFRIHRFRLFFLSRLKGARSTSRYLHLSCLGEVCLTLGQRFDKHHRAVIYTPNTSQCNLYNRRGRISSQWKFWLDTQFSVSLSWGWRNWGHDTPYFKRHDIDSGYYAVMRLVHRRPGFN